MNEPSKEQSQEKPCVHRWLQNNILYLSSEFRDIQHVDILDCCLLWPGWIEDLCMMFLWAVSCSCNVSWFLLFIVRTTWFCLSLHVECWIHAPEAVRWLLQAPFSANNGCGLLLPVRATFSYLTLIAGFMFVDQSPDTRLDSSHRPSDLFWPGRWTIACMHDLV